MVQKILNFGQTNLCLVCVFWAFICVCLIMSHYFATPWTAAHQASPWNFSDKNTWVGFYFLLQGVFPTQGLNPCILQLLYCRQILYLLSHYLIFLIWKRIILVSALTASQKCCKYEIRWYASALETVKYFKDVCMCNIYMYI